MRGGPFPVSAYPSSKSERGSIYLLLYLSSTRVKRVRKLAILSLLFKERT